MKNGRKKSIVAISCVAILTIITACSKEPSESKSKSIPFPEAFGFYVQSNTGNFGILANSKPIEKRKNYGKPTVGELGHTNAMQALSDPRFGKAHIVTSVVFKPEDAKNILVSPEVAFFAVNSQRPTVKWYGLVQQDNGDLLWKTSDSWKRQAQFSRPMDPNTIAISNPSEGVFKYTLPNLGNRCIVIETIDLGASNMHPVCFK
jgi:hypothetical protein